METGDLRKKRVPWRDNSSFVVTFYSILTAMVGAVLAIAISDKEIANAWYWPIGFLSLIYNLFYFRIGKVRRGY
jgi:hypothetical protein